MAPAPTATPAGIPDNTPVVLVYPFEEPTDLDPKYGQAIAQIYAQVLAQSGGIHVLEIPTNIKRVDYATYAHIQHADYYISGYIQPIGENAAIVAQVVDVSTGISVENTTTQISDVQDVASQALTTRTVIREAAGVERPSGEISEESSTPAPQSTGNGTSYNVSNVLGDLFKKGKGDKSAPAATATPAKPSRSITVAALSGNAPGSLLATGTNVLLASSDAYYATARTNTLDPAKNANAICGTNRNTAIATGQLDVTHVGGFRAHDSYTFTLNLYTCFGAVLYTTTQTDDDYKKAIKLAVDQYHTDHPDNS
jgi:TolB-like protein